MKPYLVIAGAGSLGRELAKRFSTNWHVGLIDKNPQPFEHLLSSTTAEASSESAAEPVHIVGDATSRLTLSAANVGNCHIALAVMGDDEANLEFCRLVKASAPNATLISEIYGTDNHSFADLGVETVNSIAALASLISTKASPGRKTTADIGLGHGDLCEVTVLPNSAVIGKSLGELVHPRSWLVGAIYRRNRLIMPHEDVIFQADDRVLLIGQPEVLPRISNYFRSGLAAFPTQYGSTIMVSPAVAGPDSTAIHEALYLGQQATVRTVVLTADKQQADDSVAEGTRRLPYSCKYWPDDSPIDALQHMLVKNDCGCYVVPPQHQSLLVSLGLRRNRFLQTLDKISCPVLVARGTFPYQKILLAVSEEYCRPLELALNLSGTLNASLTAATAIPEELVIGEEAVLAMRAALNKTTRTGALYSIKIETMELAGNPISSILDAAKDYDLLVVAHRQKRPFRFTKPDVSQHLLMRACCSTMLLPYSIEASHGNRNS